MWHEGCQNRLTLRSSWVSWSDRFVMLRSRDNTVNGNTRSTQLRVIRRGTSELLRNPLPEDNLLAKKTSIPCQNGSWPNINQISIKHSYWGSCLSIVRTCASRIPSVVIPGVQQCQVVSVKDGCALWACEWSESRINLAFSSQKSTRQTSCVKEDCLDASNWFCLLVFWS